MRKWRWEWLVATLSLALAVVLVVTFVLAANEKTAGEATAERVHQQVTSFLNTPPPPTAQPSSAETSAVVTDPVETVPEMSAVFATIDIPKIGLEFPIKAGAGLETLHAAVGYYPNTQLPGQLGNFAVAGHVCCVGNGEPFKRLNELREGDRVVVTTLTHVYTYTVVPMPACGLGQPLIVDEHKVDVIDPVPCQTGQEITRKLMTMTTCTPYGSAHTPWRLIVFAEQTDVRVRTP